MVVLIGIIVGCFLLLQTTRVRYTFDKYKLLMPKVGSLNQIILSERFAETTSTLYATGMSLLDVMDITQRVLNNTYLNDSFEEAKEEVKKGVTLSQAIKGIQVFPPMLSNMIHIGEESGQLEQILEKTAHYYTEESDTAVQKLVAILEPIMIVFLGIMVALIIAAILPPLYEMIGNIS